MSKKKSLAVSRKKQYEVTSLEDLMTHSYGAKGTYNREIAEIKIKAIAKNISFLNTLKEKSQKN